MITEFSRMHRATTIGSSDVATILGLNQHATAHDLYLQKRGRVPGFKGNEATELGEQLEAMMVDWALTQLNAVSLERDVECIHADSPEHIANLDALIIEARSEAEACGGAPEETNLEIKTAGLTGRLNFDEWGESWTDEVPIRHRAQVQFQMYCRGPRCKKTYLAALLGGRGREMFTIHRHERFINEIMLPGIRAFHAALMEGNPPPVPPSLEVIRQVERVAGMEYPISPEKVELYERWGDVEKKAKKRKEAALAGILAELNNGDLGIFDGGKFTYNLVERAGYAVQPCSYRLPKVVRAKKKENSK